MTWLLWRQNRAQWAIAALLAVLFAVPVWITGEHLRSAVSNCTAAIPCSGSAFNGYQAMNTLVDVTVLVPAVIGVFWGAAVLGKELEFGTAALVWAQSVPRRRWVAAKLAALVAGSLAASGAVSALVSWWSYTHNALVESRFGGLQFDIQGVTPVGYTLFASALGFTAGVLWRRTLPAMATTVAGFVGVRLVVELFARPHYRTPVRVLSPLSKDQRMQQGALNISSMLYAHGHAVTGPVAVSRTCAGASSRAEMNRCMASSGYQLRTVFQPANRYWTFQWIEFGIFVALAAVLLAVGVVVLRRRDA